MEDSQIRRLMEKGTLVEREVKGLCVNCPMYGEGTGIDGNCLRYTLEPPEGSRITDTDDLFFPSMVCEYAAGALYNSFFREIHEIKAIACSYKDDDCAD